MRSTSRIWLLASCCLALTALAPYGAGADEPAQPAAASDSAACPGAANGQPCCTTCQDKLAKGVDPAKSEGGCPCQRARKAREAAAAAAKAQQPE